MGINLRVTLRETLPNGETIEWEELRHFPGDGPRAIVGYSNTWEAKAIRLWRRIFK